MQHLFSFLEMNEMRKNVHRLTNGNRTAHAYRASPRTVLMDGMAPSASEATGPYRREQPKDRAAAQPNSLLPPAEPGGTHLLPKPRKRSSCFSCCQTSQKNTLVSADQRPPTWTPKTSSLARPCSPINSGCVFSFLRLARAKDFPSVVAVPR